MLYSVVSKDFIEKVESIGRCFPNEYNSRYDPAPAQTSRGYTDDGPCGEEDGPTLYIVTGPGGAGKSSAVVSTGLDRACDMRMISCNNYERCLTDKENSLKFAREQCMSLSQSLVKIGITFGIECPCTDDSTLRLAQQTAKNDYRISFVYMAICGPEIGFGRKLRSGNSFIGCNWEEEYNGYYNSLKLLDKFMDIADEASVFDNSGSSPVLQFIKKDKKYYAAPEKYRAEWLFPYAKHASNQRITYIPKDIPLFKKG